MVVVVLVLQPEVALELPLPALGRALAPVPVLERVPKLHWPELEQALVPELVLVRAPELPWPA